MKYAMRSVSSPAPAPVMPESSPAEMHIVKKYGKFHGHVKMADGAEHHAAPMASMSEAHQALGNLMEQRAGPNTVEEAASEPPNADVNA
jgi:hypothetical protein